MELLRMFTKQAHWWPRGLRNITCYCKFVDLHPTAGLSRFLFSLFFPFLFSFTELSTVQNAKQYSDYSNNYDVTFLFDSLHHLTLPLPFPLPLSPPYLSFLVGVRQINVNAGFTYHTVGSTTLQGIEWKQTASPFKTVCTQYYYNYTKHKYILDT